MRCTWMDPLLTNWFIRVSSNAIHNVWGIGALKLFPESEWLGHSLKEKELVKKPKVVLIPLEAQPKGSQSDTWMILYTAWGPMLFYGSSKFQSSVASEMGPW